MVGVIYFLVFFLQIYNFFCYVKDFWVWFHVVFYDGNWFLFRYCPVIIIIVVFVIISIIDLISVLFFLIHTHEPHSEVAFVVKVYNVGSCDQVIWYFNGLFLLLFYHQLFHIFMGCFDTLHLLFLFTFYDTSFKQFNNLIYHT